MTKKEEREFRKLQIENEELKEKMSTHTGRLMREVVYKNVAHRFAKELLEEAINTLKEAEL